MFVAILVLQDISRTNAISYRVILLDGSLRLLITVLHRLLIKQSSKKSDVASDNVIGVHDLTAAQCQKLIQMLTTKLGSRTLTIGEVSQSGPLVSNIFGIDSTIPSSAWVIDISATHHVCHVLSMFSSSKPVENAKVTLPNGLSVPIVRT